MTLNSKNSWPPAAGEFKGDHPGHRSDVEGERRQCVARLLKPMGSGQPAGGGLPVGGNLEYVDEVTLGKAWKAAGNCNF